MTISVCAVMYIISLWTFTITESRISKATFQPLNHDVDLGSRNLSSYLLLSADFYVLALKTLQIIANYIIFLFWNQNSQTVNSLSQETQEFRSAVDSCSGCPFELSKLLKSWVWWNSKLSFQFSSSFKTNVRQNFSELSKLLQDTCSKSWLKIRKKSREIQKWRRPRQRTHDSNVESNSIFSR